MNNKRNSKTNTCNKHFIKMTDYESLKNNSILFSVQLLHLLAIITMVDTKPRYYHVGNINQIRILQRHLLYTHRQ